MGFWGGAFQASPIHRVIWQPKSLHPTLHPTAPSHGTEGGVWDMALSVCVTPPRGMKLGLDGGQVSLNPATACIGLWSGTGQWHGWVCAVMEGGMDGL